MGNNLKEKRLRTGMSFLQSELAFCLPCSEAQSLLSRVAARGAASLRAFQTPGWRKANFPTTPQQICLYTLLASTKPLATASCKGGRQPRAN